MVAIDITRLRAVNIFLKNIRGIAMIHKVLVVEDSPDLGELYQQIFRNEQEYEIKLAENGQVALEILQDQSFKPEAILLDLFMPVMDGAQFIQEQRKNPDFAKIPVLVCSASKVGIPEGVAYLQKPVDLDALIKALDKICHAQKLQ